MFGATHGFTDDAPCVFGVPKLVWSEATKVEGGYLGTRGCYRELKGVCSLGTRARRRPAYNKPSSEEGGPKNSLDTAPRKRVGEGRKETAREESTHARRGRPRGAICCGLNFSD